MQEIRALGQSCQAQPSLAGFGVAIALETAVAQLLAAKSGANLSRPYLKSLGYYLSRFIQGREQRALASVSATEIEAFLKQFESANSRATWLNRISTLFSFAVRRDYLPKNPCAVLERITIDREAPFILTPAQSHLLLQLTPTLLRPYLILGLFAGIRPEELLRLEWDAVCLETKTVKVDKAKTRRRRIVPLPEKAVALLRACPLQTGPVSPSNSTVRRWKRTARLALGLPSWPSDLLRHTAASYLLALHGDAGKVAAMLGNSSAILLTHYHQPVTKEAAAAFFAILPKTDALR